MSEPADAGGRSGILPAEPWPDFPQAGMDPIVSAMLQPISTTVTDLTDRVVGFLATATDNTMEFLAKELVAPVTRVLGEAEAVTTDFVTHSVARPFAAVLETNLRGLLLKLARPIGDVVEDVVMAVGPVASELVDALARVLDKAIPAAREWVRAASAQLLQVLDYAERAPARALEYVAATATDAATAFAGRLEGALRDAAAAAAQAIPLAEVAAALLTAQDAAVQFLAADPDREAAATQFIAGAAPRLEAVIIEALEAELAGLPGKGGKAAAVVARLTLQWAQSGPAIAAALARALDADALAADAAAAAAAAFEEGALAVVAAAAGELRAGLEDVVYPVVFQATQSCRRKLQVDVPELLDDLERAIRGPVERVQALVCALTEGLSADTPEALIALIPRAVALVRGQWGEIEALLRSGRVLERWLAAATQAPTAAFEAPMAAVVQLLLRRVRGGGVAAALHSAAERAGAAMQAVLDAALAARAAEVLSAGLEEALRGLNSVLGTVGAVGARVAAAIRRLAQPVVADIAATAWGLMTGAAPPVWAPAVRPVTTNFTAAFSLKMDFVFGAGDAVFLLLRPFSGGDSASGAGDSATNSSTSSSSLAATLAPTVRDMVSSGWQSMSPYMTEALLERVLDVAAAPLELLLGDYVARLTAEAKALIHKGLDTVAVAVEMAVTPGIAAFKAGAEGIAALLGPALLPEAVRGVEFGLAQVARTQDELRARLRAFVGEAGDFLASVKALVMGQVNAVALHPATGLLADNAPVVVEAVGALQGELQKPEVRSVVADIVPELPLDQVDGLVADLLACVALIPQNPAEVVSQVVEALEGELATSIGALADTVQGALDRGVAAAVDCVRRHLLEPLEHAAALEAVARDVLRLVGDDVERAVPGLVQGVTAALKDEADAMLDAAAAALFSPTDLMALFRDFTGFMERTATAAAESLKGRIVAVLEAVAADSVSAQLVLEAVDTNLRPLLELDTDVAQTCGSEVLQTVSSAVEEVLKVFPLPWPKEGLRS